MRQDNVDRLCELARQHGEKIIAFNADPPTAYCYRVSAGDVDPESSRRNFGAFDIRPEDLEDDSPDIETITGRSFMGGWRNLQGDDCHAFDVLPDGETGYCDYSGDWVLTGVPYELQLDPFPMEEVEAAWRECKAEQAENILDL